jgi:hypothetical protein
LLISLCQTEEHWLNGIEASGEGAGIKAGHMQQWAAEWNFLLMGCCRIWRQGVKQSDLSFQQA